MIWKYNYLSFKFICNQIVTKEPNLSLGLLKLTLTVFYVVWSNSDHLRKGEEGKESHLIKWPTVVFREGGLVM